MHHLAFLSLLLRLAFDHHAVPKKRQQRRHGSTAIRPNPVHHLVRLQRGSLGLRHRIDHNACRHEQCSHRLLFLVLAHLICRLYHTCPRFCLEVSRRDLLGGRHDLDWHRSATLPALQFHLQPPPCDKPADFAATGWVAMVSGQSFVLWSRLNLVVRSKRILNGVLAAIIINGIALHTPTLQWRLTPQRRCWETAQGTTSPIHDPPFLCPWRGPLGEPVQDACVLSGMRELVQAS